jgi:hypothetical protein
MKETLVVNTTPHGLNAPATMFARTVLFFVNLPIRLCAVGHQ